MPTSKSLAALSSALTLGCAVLFSSVPALAYTACNGNGDCWHTEDRVTFPGVTLTFHDDKWQDQHRTDAQYHWHEADADHDWHHGYWNNGEWHHE
jgi:hypothetical protein